MVRPRRRPHLAFSPRSRYQLSRQTRFASFLPLKHSPMPKVARPDSFFRRPCPCPPCAASTIPQFHTEELIVKHLKLEQRLASRRARVPSPIHHGEQALPEDGYQDDSGVFFPPAASLDTGNSPPPDLPDAHLNARLGSPFAAGPSAGSVSYAGSPEPARGRSHSIRSLSGSRWGSPSRPRSRSRSRSWARSLSYASPVGRARSHSNSRGHSISPDRAAAGQQVLPSREPSPVPSVDDDGIDISGDPLAASNEEIFDKILEDAEDDATTYNHAGGRPPALTEHPLIRNAYVHVYIASTVHGATKELCKQMLDGYHSTFSALPQTAQYEVAGLDKMARTLRTVVRRLGVDPDRYITFYFVCNVCWDHHHPSELYHLDGPGCNTRADCPGVLYACKTTSEGKLKRIPVKVLPTTALIDSLFRIASRPGKMKDWNAWRGDDDEPGRTPPAAREDWPGWQDGSHRMYDIMDGWGWRTVSTLR